MAHVLMLALLVELMYVLKLGVIFKAGLVVIAALILYEHAWVCYDRCIAKTAKIANRIYALNFCYQKYLYNNRNIISCFISIQYQITR